MTDNTQPCLSGGWGCAKEYPMVEDIPSGKQLLNFVLPEKFQTEDILEQLDKFSSILGAVTPESGAAQILDTIAKNAISAVAAIVAADAPVNLILAIKDTIFMVLKVINLILLIVQNGLIITDTATSEETMRLLFDILNIDFGKGFDGVECHVKHILKEYKKRGITTDIICQVFNPLYNALIDFMGSVLSTIPFTAGIPRTLIKMASVSNRGKRFIMNQVIRITKQQYSKLKKERRVPKELRNMFEDPKALENYIKCVMTGSCDQKGGFGLKTGMKLAKKLASKATVTLAKNSGKYQELMNNVAKYSGLFAYMISKVFVFALALIYIFRDTDCSKYDKSARKMQTDKGIADTKQSMKEMVSELKK